MSNRKEKISLSENKYKKTEPIIVEGTHKAIVSKSEFDKANLVIKKSKRTKERTPTDFLLKSKVRCGNCKRLMKRKQGAKEKFYFSCAYSYNDNESLCPTGNTLSEEELNVLILNNINDFLQLAKLKLKAIKKNNKINMLLQKEMTSLEKEKLRITTIKSNLYEKYASDKLSRDEYISRKEILETNIRDIEIKLEEIQSKIFDESVEKNNNRELLEEIIDQYGVVKNLDKNIVQTFIKSVFIYSKEQVEIELNFKDLFTNCTPIL